MTNHNEETLTRIQEALELAKAALKPFVSGAVEASYKSPGDPVTEADHAVNRVLQRTLLRHAEGWFSEESEDDLSRLHRDRLWIVDPLDGTREFVSGIPEWCVSIAYVENGVAVAGGVANPATGETFIGSLASGLHYTGTRPVRAIRSSLKGAAVLASRSEVKRGEWNGFEGAPFNVIPTGSVAYKLAQVAAGLADATWTLTPKHEWDVAGGVALMDAAGGFVRTLDLARPAFNRKSPLLPGLVACGGGLKEELISWLKPYLPPPADADA